MKSVDDWIHQLRRDLDVPVLGAAETGERAWGTADDTTKHKITVVRLESPVEHALPSGSGRLVNMKARASRTSASRDPIAQWAQANSLPDTISIESFDFPQFCERAERNPRVLHFLQSPIQYGAHDAHIEAFKQAVYQNLAIRTLVREYQGWARDMFDRDETVGHQLGAAAALSRAKYIARRETLPPMYVDAFIDEASEEIVRSVGRGQFEAMLRRLRQHGRAHTVEDLDLSRLERELDVNLVNEYNVSRNRASSDVFTSVLRETYEEYYDV